VVQNMSLERSYPCTTRYTIHFVQSDTSDEFEVRLSEYEYLMYNGEPVKGALAERFKVASTLAQLQPPMRISSDGLYMGAPRGYDIRQVWANHRKTTLADISDEDWQNLEPMLNSPDFEASAYLGGFEYWHRWVAAWRGFDNSKSGPIETTDVIRLPGNLHYTAKGQVSKLSDESLAGDLVKLQYVSTQQDPALTTFKINDIIKNTPVPTDARTDPEYKKQVVAEMRKMISKVTKTVVIEAVIHGTDHRPLEVSAKETTRVEVVKENGPNAEKVDVDTHHYTFEWQ
jgi:hypothetical protein